MRTIAVCMLSLMLPAAALHGQALSLSPSAEIAVTVPQSMQLSMPAAADPARALDALHLQSPHNDRPIRALGVETLGGTMGWAVGFGSVLLLTDAADCGENLSCTLGIAGSALLLGSVAAAGGTYAMGRLGDTSPSGVGSTIGAVAGVAAVIGADHVMSNVNTSDARRYVMYAVTQGFVTALGSRIGALMR